MESINLEPNRRLRRNDRFTNKKECSEYGSLTTNYPWENLQAIRSNRPPVPYTIFLQIEPIMDDIRSTIQTNEPSLISLNETEVAEPEPTDELVYDGFYGPTTHAPRRSGTSYSPRLKIVEFSDSIAGFHIVCRSGGGCGDLFESLDALIYHVKTYHGRKQKENTFECYYCKKNVADRHSVERHMNAVHTSHSMFKCPFPACPRSFNRQFNLKRHIKCIHTKKKKHECTMCTMKYYYKHLLTNHSANEHGKGSARPSQKLVSLVKCSTKANSRPRLMRTKSRELESFKSKTMTSNVRRLTKDRGADLMSDEDCETFDNAGTNGLVKNEPAIDIDFDDVEETNGDTLADCLSACDEKLVGINLEINELGAVRKSPAAAPNDENVILIKNEPDDENGEIHLCKPLIDAPCPETSLIDDETDSEVDIDNDNYCKLADPLTHIETSIMNMGMHIDMSSIKEIGNNPGTTLQNNFVAENAKAVNGNVDRFTIRCRSRGCKDLFETWDAMLYHVETYHSRLQNQNTFQCHYCKKTLGEKQSHQRHMSLYHFGRSLFKCSFGTCSKSFPRLDYLEKHINALHTKRNLFKCTKCPKKFTFKQNMIWHLAYKHGVGVSYNCYLCKKKLGEPRSLWCHMKSQHTIRGFPFKCPVCRNGFKLHRYIRKHLKRNPLTCGRISAAASKLKK